MVEHRAICNTICWHQHALNVRQDDRLLLLVPYVFDASISIIFPALVAGAELVLAVPGEERDPARILERIARDEVTILPILPRMLRLMLDDRLGQAGRHLRWLYCGGETMPPDVPARLFELLDVPLYNLYGPTETAIDATCWPCRRGDDRPNHPHRPAHRQRPSLRTGSTPEAGSHRCAGRTIRRRRGSGARLP